MNTKGIVRRVKKAIVVALFALALGFLLVPVTNSVKVQAAPKKVTCKKRSKALKSPKIMLKKKYKVTNKGQDVGFVRFVADKTRVYTISISNYRSVGYKTPLGSVMDDGEMSLCVVSVEDYKKNLLDDDTFWYQEWKRKALEGEPFIRISPDRWSIPAKRDEQIELDEGKEYFILVMNDTSKNKKKNKGFTFDLVIK